MLSHSRRYSDGIRRGQSDPWQGVNTSDLAISLPSRGKEQLMHKRYFYFVLRLYYMYILCPRDMWCGESLLQYMEKMIFLYFMIREHKELGRKDEPTTIHQRWQAAEGQVGGEHQEACKKVTVSGAYCSSDNYHKNLSLRP
ncbi:uncharacterized protein [Lolium perenne]|uniref:uncharacterized protein isoform X2 n=1 Tax=Lolium perenne TaxID=4522 RepID=UPI003A9A5010